LSEKLRDDGLIVLKQPDVFSQARLTHFRTDFETQMHNDLVNFQLVLAARINRLDAATTTQTTNLSAALAAPGSSAVHMTATTGANGAITVPGAPSAPPNIPSTATGTGLDMTKGPFSNIGLENAVPSPNAAMALGVDPTVYLDEKKRFLEHLNEIRRINLGPDQNDSSGYGLYLVRMPVSITPGEKTYQGFGAELAVTVEHEFSTDFLPKTFRNLVINDVVDHLGPLIFEVIRSGAVDRFQNPWELKGRLEQLQDRIVNEFVRKKIWDKVVVTPEEAERETAMLQPYILRSSPGLDTGATLSPEGRKAVACRLDALLEAFKKIAAFPETVEETRQQFETMKRTGRPGVEGKDRLKKALEAVVATDLYVGEPGQLGVRSVDEVKLAHFVAFLGELYRSALDDDVDILSGFLLRDRTDQPPSERESLKRERELLKQLTGGFLAAQTAFRNEVKNVALKLSLPSTRSPKQLFPLAPREVGKFFLPENILELAKDAKQSMMTRTPRATDVRNYLRQSLDTAYNAMTFRPTPDSPAQPFANTSLMQRIEFSALKRHYDGNDPGSLSKLFDELVANLEQERRNFRDPETGVPGSLAALSWAVALDAALFDHWLKYEATRAPEAHGTHRELPDSQHFYLPEESAEGIEVLAQETREFFQEFVKLRWPIITFALDPVTDQQNVADSFNLKRDLQLALSYAFATGQINFGQLNTFRRQIEQSSDTIALNRTVTGFAHGNDTFGFRFSPRFQNPPAQRTNIGVIASQLISGGPGPDYQTKKSKLEAGMREITAVILVPTFLPTMRMNIASNWFRLTDPEHLVFHSARAMERGRQVQELRQAALHVCSAQQYREEDVRVLQTKLKQLDQMLPQQSRVVQLPFENTASGWDLFTEGAKALVPELSGYDGVDVVTQGTAADIFIYGKYIHLLDTQVIIGGAYVPKSPPGMVDIISREVVHVRIPETALPTTTVDGQTYFEVYLATPSGISNRVLVPCRPKTPPAPNGFDLATDAGSQELDIFYQWMNGADGKPALILTDDPGAVDKKPLKITWDSPTGFAPKTLQANFTATLPTGQTATFSLPANSGTKDDYAVDRRQIALILLKRFQSIVSPPGALPPSISLSVTVQPYVPLESMGYRVQSKAKALKTQYTVKFIYNATDKNALPNVAPAALNTIPADAAVMRTAMQQPPSPSIPTLSIPGVETPPLPPLPSVPGFPGVPPSTAAQAELALSQPANAAASTAQATLNSAAGRLPTSPLQAPQVLVNPSPVVVVNQQPAAGEKPRSRFHRFLEHMRNTNAPNQASR